VVAGDAVQLDPVRGAQRLDALEVALGVRAVPEPEVAELVGHGDVPALAERPETVRGRGGLALQVADEPHHHDGDDVRAGARTFVDLDGPRRVAGCETHSS
jgi:hypothetical protein